MRASKYNAARTGKYASGAEARRAGELKLLERAGKIENLGEQVKYEIIPKQDGERAAHYIADFVYTDTTTGLDIVEDVKGVRTKEYILKRKLMLLVHGIKIREVS
jgi:hypothetical protein